MWAGYGKQGIKSEWAKCRNHACMHACNQMLAIASIAIINAMSACTVRIGHPSLHHCTCMCTV